MAKVSIHNLTLQKVELSNRKNIKDNFNHYKELKSCTLPVMAKLNGEWTSREKDWETPLKESDIVEFHIMPQGGGSSREISRMVATIAVTVIGYVVGGPWGVAIGIVGTYAVNTLISLPLPKIPGMNYMEKESPTYSLQAQGNSARISDPVTLIYGRHMVYADYGALPYKYYENNDEYLNQLFVIGLGEYDIEKIRIEDTDIANFKEITYEIIQPNQPITLFNHNCVQATEVASQTLKHDEYQGGFTLNKPDTVIKAIEVDFIAPRGIYKLDAAGNFADNSVTVTVDVRKIDAEENPIGKWITVITETITANQSRVVRKTFKADVEPARYEVRAKRTTEESTDSRESSQITWAGLKGFANHEITYPNMTLVAMKMKATDNLSTATSRKVNFIVTRKLPTWTPTIGWSEPVATQSIAWAMADVCRASFCANMSDDEINLNQLYQLDQEYQALGFTFNAVFDSKLSLLETLERIGKTGNTLAYSQAGKINFVRDSMQDIPSMMFTSNHIKKDSFNINYLLPTSESVDYAEVTYFDERIWTNKTFDVALDENVKTKKIQMTLFGVTNRTQATTLATYHLKNLKYRRRVVNFDTEMDGSIPTIGSLIKLSYPMPKWGVNGYILNYDAENLTVKLSESVIMEEGKEYYIGLRNLQGEAESPIKVTRDATMVDTQLKLTQTPTFEIYTGDKKDKTSFVFGESNEVNIFAKVNNAVARNELTYTVTATIDDERVYE